MPESKSSPRRIEARLRQAQALRLRMGGASFDDIARQLGLKDASGAYRSVTAALRDIPKADAEAYRKLNLERLNRMLLALWPSVLSADLKPMAQCLDIIVEINKLTGAYAPARLDVRVDVLERVRELAREFGMTDAETAEAVAAAERIIRGGA